MIWEGNAYKPTVVWRTYVRETFLVSEETINTPAVYQTTISPIDKNEVSNPGADTADKQVGYFLMDFIGRIYRITAINIGGNSERVQVSDDFRWGECPENGQQGLVYQALGSGYAPWLVSKYGTHLSRVAMQNAMGIDHSILWKTSEKIEFTNTNAPSITNYQANYAIPYGQLPKFVLMTYDSAGVEWERQEVPVRNFVGGLLDSIVWDLSDIYSGYIIISR